ncbi:type II secretion system F family protein [Burkholderia gladioli]|uniref:type II secretion system F family protein n=1 Tax=Burkholderia gladioli TaxID=28095 RepID=UPI000D00B5EC|nr:type II secretion system F family protein [Burkholderia gladioli]MBU9323024.1 type II secretion system F family protein [Burkholderia gladioli]MDN7808502.1 type II secretion system F family protein [Burkholderia gladioli]PRH30259.1 type II secretion system F family protein [Burkholderia gladioli]
MPMFRVRLLRDGQLATQAIEAADEAELRARLRASAAPAVVLDVRRQRRLGGARRQPRFALALFLQELSSLLDAGLVLIEALEALHGKRDGGRQAQQVIGRVLAVMVEGQPFSAALARQPGIFPALLVATIESAEGNGQLPEVLRRYQQYEHRIEQIRKRVRGAMVYPGVVIGVGFCILLFMAFFVIPRFSAVFEALSTLPPTARLMLAWSGLLARHGALVWAALAGSIAAIGLALRTQAAQRAARQLIWRLPKLREAGRLFALTRFYRTVGLLIHGGTPAIAALEMAGRLLPEPYRAGLAAALVDLRAGLPVSAVLASRQLTTSVAERLLRVGEQSGDLGGMCEQIAHFHDAALDRSVELLSKVFEPVLMLAVGATVGTVVILLYLPIFELASSLG